MINSNKILGNILGNKPRRDRVSMNKIYNEDECFYHRDGCITTTRCPECKNHGKDIETRGDRLLTTTFPIKEKAVQLITQQNIYNSPHPTFTLIISARFPLEITMIAPVTEIIMPATFIRYNLSLKK